jgi:hypothetical protein
MKHHFNTFEDYLDREMGGLGTETAIKMDLEEGEEASSLKGANSDIN